MSGRTGARKRKKAQHVFAGIKKRATAETSSNENVKSSAGHETAQRVASTIGPTSTTNSTTTSKPTTKYESSTPDSNVKSTTKAASSTESKDKPSLGLADYSDDD
ncbi:hypothetical protein MRB53_038760 [Persea americana]|nr:hypothetical protein MRB53_038760 [Persea americana]